MVAPKLGQTLLYVPDVEASSSFYERVFGLARSLVDPDGIYIALDGGGATLAFANAEWVAKNGLRFGPIDREQTPPAVELNFFVADVQRSYDDAIAAGATAWFPPAAQPWGQTVAYVRDPAGFLVEIATFPPAPARAGDEPTAQLRGGCHCGNIGVVFDAARPIAALGVRACTCTFCRPRHLRWTSDPEGLATITIVDAAKLCSYRFGTSTADFLICARCGQVVAAVSDDAEPRAVINVDVLARADELPAAEPRDFDGEDVATRLARRARSWMPAIVRRGIS
jgi:catechol 2,3-dioxygenase-like lactoylglutathione lyase family enzyme